MKDFAVPYVVSVLSLMLVGLISILLIFTTDQAIVTGEAFKVTSDTSKYSCIITEIDNDLSLNCLRLK
jgi:hypothetical protein